MLHHRYAPYSTGDADNGRRAGRLHPRAGDGHGERRRILRGAPRPQAEPNSPDDDWVEYEAGNVTLAVMTTAHPRLRVLRAATVDDRAARRRRRGSEGEARRRRVSRSGRCGTPASATARGQRSRPATASSSTAATRRIPTARRRDAGRARRLRLLLHPGHRAGEALLCGGARLARSRRRARATWSSGAGQVTLDIFDPVERRAGICAESRRDGAARPRCRRRAGGARGEGSRVRRRDRRHGVCHMAFFKDPDGNALILHRRYAPRD